MLDGYESLFFVNGEKDCEAKPARAWVGKKLFPSPRGLGNLLQLL